MINSLRNFAKTKIAGIFVFIIIIPFVFWGMGSVFNSGNTNNIAKINNDNISTQDFLDYLRQLGLSDEVIKNNIEKNIIEELLSNLVSTKILALEVEDLEMTISNETLIKKIKKNKNFQDEKGLFKRTKYEKFLLSNNITAPSYEKKLKENLIQKQLFDYIGAGTHSPKFLVNKIFIEENKQIKIKYFNLENSYKKRESFSSKEIENFLNENESELQNDYIDFSYVKITPKKLIGLDDYNEAFFQKIDEIENKISKNTSFQSIISEINLDPINVSNYTDIKNIDSIESKIFNSRNNATDIIEIEGFFILYNINKLEKKLPDLNDAKNKDQIVNLLYEKNKFDFNNKILEEINIKKFNNSSFNEISKNSAKDILIKSRNDDQKFSSNSIEILYSLPKNSFTLIADDQENIFIAKIIDINKKKIDFNNKNVDEFIFKENSNNRESILKSYDTLLNEKYKVTVNQKTLERVKNYFQ